MIFEAPDGRAFGRVDGTDLSALPPHLVAQIDQASAELRTTMHALTGLHIGLALAERFKDQQRVERATVDIAQYTANLDPTTMGNLVNSMLGSIVHDMVIDRLPTDVTTAEEMLAALSQRGCFCGQCPTEEDNTS